ncbi:unnamed protein product, partial [Mesorhabditis spiculigera]
MIRKANRIFSYLPTIFFILIWALCFSATIILILKSKARQAEAHVPYAPVIQKPPNITVLVVVNNDGDLWKYETALATLRCYCKMHHYTFKIIFPYDYIPCYRKDFMFVRHCIVVEHLVKTDYVFFVDADMAVVNPKRRIEEFIDPNFDITFYERFINVEIAAGSYLVKNTRWARNFLMDFSLYGDKLDDRVIGSDNAALHMFLAEELYPELKDLLKQCQSAQKLVDWGELYVYEICVRMIIGNHYELKNHVRIMKKGTGWVRDIWLADSRWNPKMDFILHGYQEKRILPFNGTFIKRAQLPWMEKAGFYKIMKSKPLLKKCKNTDYTFDFDDRFLKPMFEIKPVLDDIRAEVELKKWQFAGMVPKFQEK